MILLRILKKAKIVTFVSYHQMLQMGREWDIRSAVIHEVEKIRTSDLLFNCR